MLPIHFLKFFHVLLALCLFGSSVYCLILVGSRKFSASAFSATDNIQRLHKILLLLSAFAVLTGTLLVLPRHFTFQTPWIQTAYLITLLFVLGVCLLISLKKTRLTQHQDEKISKTRQWTWRLAYLTLILFLIGITHDAVTKTSLLY